MIKKKFFTSTINKIINKNSIQTVYNFAPVIKMLKFATKDTLVIFDVDNVLIRSGGEDDFRHPYRTKLWQEIKCRSTPQKIECLCSSILYATKRYLTDLRIIDIFNYLKLQNVPAIALTTMGTGNFGIIEKMEDIRVNELNDLGISFLPLTPIRDELLVPELENTHIVFPYCKGTPMLKYGIIFTAGVDKRVVLEYMFNKYNYYPKNIIFVDDCIKNLESLETLNTKLNLNFYGFHYAAASLTKFPNIDENLERLRFKFLEQESCWLSYEKLMNKRYIRHNYRCL